MTFLTWNRPMTEIPASLIAFQRRFHDDDAGTLLHRTKLSLAIWFRAACLMATHCNGISALQLQKQLGTGSCRSAWMLAAKLRRAMVNPERSPLSGLVEIDEASLPQRDKGAPSGPGRNPEGKMPVAGAVELGDGNTPGHLRLATIPSCNAKGLGNFAVHNTAATATGPMSSATGPPMKFSPGSTPRSATLEKAASSLPSHSWCCGNGIKSDGTKCFVGRSLNQPKNRHISFLTLFLRQLRPEATCPNITSLPSRSSPKPRHAIMSIPASFS